MGIHTAVCWPHTAALAVLVRHLDTGALAVGIIGATNNTMVLVWSVLGLK